MVRAAKVWGVLRPASRPAGQPLAQYLQALPGPMDYPEMSPKACNYQQMSQACYPAPASTAISMLNLSANTPTRISICPPFPANVSPSNQLSCQPAACLICQVSVFSKTLPPVLQAGALD
mmetsp:Transcript_846/g.1524  ORF Transcript_846/g.1524 Transcript_846/m.1524 type:complete len:120 (-) Transcript_846:140-499(-)